MFAPNRESCTVNRTKTRERMKTRRKNAPSASRYWRRGRTSGNNSPPGLFIPAVQLWLEGRGHASVNADVRCVDGVFLFLFFPPPSPGPPQYLLRRILCFKTQRSGNQQRTPESTKIWNPHGTVAWHLLRFCFFCCFFFKSLALRHLLVIENNTPPTHFISGHKIGRYGFFFFFPFLYKNHRKKGAGVLEVWSCLVRSPLPQAPPVYAPLPPAVRGPVARHQQEVPHLQGGHRGAAVCRELMPLSFFFFPLPPCFGFD